MNTEELWNEFGEQIKRFIISKTKDLDSSEDILQDVFIKIHSEINTLKDKDRIQSWIFRIARNTITDYFRRRKKESFLSDEIQEPVEDKPDESFNLILEDMIKNMDELPQEYCEAICNTEFRGISQKQYAAEIGISYSGLKSRVQRARKMLKDNLMQCCHFYFDKYNTIIDYEKKCCCCNEIKQDQ